MVQIQGVNSPAVFYRNRRDNGEVSLNRPSGVMSPTGQFCCQVPDAVNVTQTLCVTIGKFFKYNNIHLSLSLQLKCPLFHLDLPSLARATHWSVQQVDQWQQLNG